MRRFRNRILLGLALIFVIYVVLGVFAGTQDVAGALQSFPWALLIPVVLLKFCAWFLRFWRWQYYLHVIGAAGKISLFDSAILFVSGFAMAVSPGKLAEVLKAVILKLKTGTPIARGAPVVFAERVVDGVAVLIMSVLAFILAAGVIDLGGYATLIWLSAGLLVFGLIAVQIRPLAYACLTLVGKLPLLRRAQGPLTAFYESSREVLHIRHIVLPTGLGMLAHLTDAIGFAIILSGFGLAITPELLLQAVFITGLTAAVGALSGVPNGAGVTEVSSSGMILAIIAPLHPVITPAVALAVALTDGFFHKWLRVVVGTVVAIIFRKRLFPAELESALTEWRSSPASEARPEANPA
jgi:uncharacterized protein (TIRG00374 family)